MTNQDIEGLQAIKIFPYEDQDSRFSNFLALSNQDIAALICGLQEKVDRLQEDRERDREEIESLRSQIASVDKEREKEFSLLNEHLVKTIIRVSVLERELKAKKAAPTEKTSPHLDKLAARLMKKREAKQFPAIGFKEASQLLGISKRRVSQLQPTIKADGRFIVQAHGKTLYIQLR
ncbi:MAG TPA: hypothetical protein PK712_07840 [Rectinema sp.]|nr:hypothetical protein [Rectinema sp.]